MIFGKHDFFSCHKNHVRWGIVVLTSSYSANIILNNQILVSFFPRDIEPGEIIAVDRPVVKHLDKEYTKTHCWHCLRSTQKYATVPCSMCSGVLFCSELCRKISQDTYHKYNSFPKSLLIKRFCIVIYNFQFIGMNVA